MKFHEIPYHAICDICGRDTQGNQSCNLDENGDVAKVYCNPCRKKERLERYQKDKIVSTQLMLSATCERVRKDFGKEFSDPVYEEICQTISELQEATTRFEEKVWKPDLFQKEKDSKCWGKIAKYSVGELRSLSCAGRVLFTFTDLEGYWITIIAASGDSDAKMGLQGMYATKEKAVQLIDVFNYEHLRRKVDLEDSKEVRII